MSHPPSYERELFIEKTDWVGDALEKWKEIDTPLVDEGARPVHVTLGASSTNRLEIEVYAINKVCAACAKEHADCKHWSLPLKADIPSAIFCLYDITRMVEHYRHLCETENRWG